MTSLAAVKRAGCPPRYMTARTPGRATLGPRVADVAAKLGNPLMAHQRALMDVALEIDPETGCLAYGEVVLVGPRQATGKTFTTLPLMTHRCMGGFSTDLADWVAKEYGITERKGLGPQAVLFLAQTADDARKRWRRTHLPQIQRSRYTKDQFNAVLTQNKEAFLWVNGSSWSPGSNTAKTSGTGDTLDLAVLDEYWAHSTSAVELGVRPAMMTRPWRQLWKTSMVPGLTRVAPDRWAPLRAAMTAGRARVEAGINRGVCYCEFSAEEGLDPADPTTWWTCMPALGQGVNESTIRDDFEFWRDKGKLGDFEAEYLGWAPRSNTPRWLVIPELMWEDRRDVASGPVDPVALAVASAQDRSFTTIGLAAQRDDGGVHVEVLDRRPGVDWAVDRLLDLVDSWDVCAITFDPAGQESSIVDEVTVRLSHAGRSTPLFRPSLREVCGASARVLDGCGVLPLAADGVDAVEDPPSPVMLWHIGQPELTRAVALAKQRLVGQGLWQWDYAGAVDPLRACTLAWWGGVRADWAGGSYNIADSLG